MESVDLPYKAEYAKSGRASCRSCSSAIAKDTLRIAVLIQSPEFDGKMAQWYHMMCFFGKQRPKTVGDIEHFESLRYEDQQKIKEKIEAFASGAVVPTEKKKGKKRGGKSDETSGNMALKDFTLEYSKSGRATCRGCEQKILKDEIRISKKDFETEVGRKYGGQDMWHHLECFAMLRNDLLYFESGEKLPGFASLKAEDMKKVKDFLPAVKQEEVPIKKPKVEDEVDGKLEKEMKSQMKLSYKYRDQLKKLGKKELQQLLEHNKQEIPTGIDTPNNRMPAKREPLKSKSVKMTVKHGSAVDPGSGLENVAHVYQQGSDKYNAVLIFTDLQKQKNFYKLQLLESDNKHRYWVFRAWGRIATTVGGNKVEEMTTLKEAKNHFKALYEEKTGNKWKNRHNFVKIPNRFYPVNVDYSQDEDIHKLTEEDVSTNLSKPVQDLLKIIYDLYSMKKVKLGFEFQRPNGPRSVHKLTKFSVTAEGRRAGPK